MPKNNIELPAEVYKLLLAQETNNHTIYISILLGIVLILLGATWWWNKMGAMKEIKGEVQKQRTKLLEELKVKMDAELESRVGLYKIKMDKELEESTHIFKNEILRLESNINRTLALSAVTEEAYGYSVYWWAKFIEVNLKLNKPTTIRSGTDLLLEDLRIIKEKYDSKEDNVFIYLEKEILNIISKLPEVLSIEKNEIVSLFNSIKEE